jgi:hypothetical protein
VHIVQFTGVCAMKINDEGRSNSAYWYERAMKAEARLAEADALLREARNDYASAMNDAQIAAAVGCNVIELGVKLSAWIGKISRIDAHLAEDA